MSQREKSKRYSSKYIQKKRRKRRGDIYRERVREKEIDEGEREV